MKIVLCDINDGLINEWKKHFSDLSNVEYHLGNILLNEADAIISPANSFGIMNGGIDLIYSNHFGWQLQEYLQNIIKTNYNNELLVGQAVAIETGNVKIPWMISAPTMRVPLEINHTPNVYLAMKAILRTAEDYKFEKILIPGLGTGCGNVPYNQCAEQMRLAYNDYYEGFFPVTLKDANKKMMKILGLI